MASILATMSSGFDYYAPMPIQNSIDYRFLIELTPINAIQPGAPFEFVAIGGEGDGCFIDTANSYFIFQVKGTTSTGAKPDAAAQVSCVNNLAHSMFSRVEAILGDKLVSDPNGLYGIQAYITDLCSR